MTIHITTGSMVDIIVAWRMEFDRKFLGTVMQVAAPTGFNLVL